MFFFLPFLQVKPAEMKLKHPILLILEKHDSKVEEVDIATICQVYKYRAVWIKNQYEKYSLQLASKGMVRRKKPLLL